jgi:hypothetical protein
MEKKLPDDKLENFLRNSLKDYSEKPSDDVWEKIDQSLDHQIVNAPGSKKWKWILSAAAVTGIMLFLAANNIYLKHKLKKEIAINKSISQLPLANKSQQYNPDSSQTQMAKEGNKTDTKNDSGIVISAPDNITSLETSPLLKGKTTPLSTKQSSESIKADDKLISEPGSVANKPEKDPEQSVVFKSGAKNSSNKPVSNKINKQELSDRNADKIKYPDKNALLAEEVKEVPKNKSIPSELSHTREYVADQTETKLSNEKKDPSVLSSLEQEEQNNKRPSLNLAKIPGNRSTIVSSLSGKRIIQSNNLTSMIPVQIASNRYGSEWSLTGGTIYESGSVIDLRRPNNQVINPTENKFTTNNSWTIGMGYSKSINKNWFVSAGLALKNYELINDINQSLTFGGRINPGTGGVPFHHDWAFKLNCPGGTSNITIQSEQLDSRATINDNEQVNVNITNKEKLKYLTIPLSMNYRSSLGKLTLLAGAGLHMNILMKSHFENPSIHIHHPQLVSRSEPNKNYRFDKSNPLVWNSNISVGLVYPILPRLSVQFSPSWLIPITNRNSDPDVRIKTTSFAFQLGLNYSIASL